MKKIIYILILLILPIACIAQDTLSVQGEAVLSADSSIVQLTIPTIPLIRYQTEMVYDTVTTEIPDTVFMYSEPEVFRSVNHQMVEDTTGAFAIRIHGQTSANKIRYASKCIGVEYATMTAIDERLGLSLEADSLGNINGTTRNYNCHYKDQNMNALMTYWLTAYTDTDTLFVRRFIDVAHIRTLGQ